MSEFATSDQPLFTKSIKPADLTTSQIGYVRLARQELSGLVQGKSSARRSLQLSLLSRRVGAMDYRELKRLRRRRRSLT